MTRRATLALVLALLGALPGAAVRASAGVPSGWLVTRVCEYREQAYGFALGHGVVIWNEAQGPQTQNLRGFIWWNGSTEELREDTGSSVSDVNERGQVVGYGSPVGSFVWQRGKWTRIAGLSYPTAIDDRGQVLGHSGDGAQLWDSGKTVSLGSMAPGAIGGRGQVVGTKDGRAYLWENGRSREISVTGWKSFHPTAITDQDKVYGYVSDRSYDPPQAWVVWQAGKATRLDRLGGRSSRPAAINRVGQAVGWYRTATWGTHAFLWQEGRLRDLGTLGGNRSEAVAINGRGAVVGRSETADGAWHGFLWQAGRMMDLGTVRPLAIDDDDEILAVDGSKVVLLTRRGAP